MSNRNSIRDEQSRFRGCLLGLACGDAVGTTNEFSHGNQIQQLTDMVGGGPFRLKPGEWTDDTSMALCLAKSLIETEQFDPADQMRRYLLWHKHGYMSSNGVCFDIGNTVLSALEHFERTGEPFSGSTHPKTAGNGAIMRLAPVPMFYFPNLDRIIHYSAMSSKTTHQAPESIEACVLMGHLIFRGLAGMKKEEILAPVVDDFREKKLQKISTMGFLDKARSKIRSSGYVIDSLEAAIWCFARTNSFEAAILKAANLGDDADTVAAICGQIAGAFYGSNNFPQPWLRRLSFSEEITKIADTLYAMSKSNQG